MSLYPMLLWDTGAMVCLIMYEIFLFERIIIPNPFEERVNLLVLIIKDTYM